MVLKMCEYDWRIVCNQPHVSFDGTTRKRIIILKKQQQNRSYAGYFAYATVNIHCGS